MSFKTYQFSFHVFIFASPLRQEFPLFLFFKLKQNESQPNYLLYCVQYVSLTDIFTLGSELIALSKSCN